MRTYALMPKDGRKSFYNKAVVRVSENGTQTLRSYTTDVRELLQTAKLNDFGLDGVRPQEGISLLFAV